MITSIMKQCGNFFDDGHVNGRFTINSDGKISPSSCIADHQYICITGSTFHNGVYRVTDGHIEQTEELPSESFDGRVWLLNPPRAFLRLCAEITDYQAVSAKTTGAFKSESFGGYSYEKATNGSGGTETWVDHFASQLTPWRRPFTNVDL